MRYSRVDYLGKDWVYYFDNSGGKGILNLVDYGIAPLVVIVSFYSVREFSERVGQNELKWR